MLAHIDHSPIDIDHSPIDIDHSPIDIDHSHIDHSLSRRSYSPLNAWLVKHRGQRIKI